MENGNTKTKQQQQRNKIFLFFPKLRKRDAPTPNFWWAILTKYLNTEWFLCKIDLRTPLNTDVYFIWVETKCENKSSFKFKSNVTRLQIGWRVKISKENSANYSFFKNSIYSFVLGKLLFWKSKMHLLFFLWRF